MPEQTPTRAVFLSYASQDAEAPTRIGEALRAAEIEEWLDGLPPSVAPASTLPTGN